VIGGREIARSAGVGKGGREPIEGAILFLGSKGVGFLGS